MFQYTFINNENLLQYKCFIAKKKEEPIHNLSIICI